MNFMIVVTGVYMAQSAKKKKKTIRYYAQERGCLPRRARDGFVLDPGEDKNDQNRETKS